MKEDHWRIVSDKEPDDHTHVDKCWCNPEVKELDGELYVFYRNSKGRTAMADLFPN